MKIIEGIYMKASKKNLDNVFDTLPLSDHSGFTLVEVVISITIMAIAAISVTAGFIYTQKSAVNDAYNTGAVRVLQMHVERIMAIPVANLVAQEIITYNYSGLRVTSLSSTDAQNQLTNATLKPFTIYSGSPVVASITNNTEDAVLAYSTLITVAVVPVTNTFNGTSYTKNFRQATVTTYWQNMRGQTMSNSAVVMRSEGN